MSDSLRPEMIEHLELLERASRLAAKTTANRLVEKGLKERSKSAIARSRERLASPIYRSIAARQEEGSAPRIKAKEPQPASAIEETDTERVARLTRSLALADKHIETG